MRYYGMGRRRQIRLIEKWPVKVSLYSREKNESLTEPVEIFTRDISFVGLALETDALPEKWSGKIEVGKTVFSVEFSLPGEKKSIVALADLIWSSKAKVPRAEGKNYALGLSFSTISKEDRDRIRKYINASYGKMEKEAERRIAG